MTPIFHALRRGPYREEAPEMMSLLLEAGAIVRPAQVWDAMPVWFQTQNAKYAPVV